MKYEGERTNRRIPIGQSGPHTITGELMVKDAAYKEYTAFLIANIIDLPVLPGFVADLGKGPRWIMPYVDLVLADDLFGDVVEADYYGYEDFTPVVVPTDPYFFAQLTVFDFILRNLDRHSYNFGQVDGKWVAFDHNYAFSEENEFYRHAYHYITEENAALALTLAQEMPKLLLPALPYIADNVYRATGFNIPIDYLEDNIKNLKADLIEWNSYIQGVV